MVNLFRIQWARRHHHLTSLGIRITTRSLVLLDSVSCHCHPLAKLRVASLTTRAAHGANTKTPNGKKGGNAWGKNKKGARNSGEEARVLLPEQLMNNVIALSAESTAKGGCCNVYLVGVVHGAQESCRQVQAVISYLKPQAVFLELCSGRRHLLEKAENLRVRTKEEIRKMWWNNQINTLQLLMTLPKRLNTKSEPKLLSGAEFRVAYKEALKYGAKVILGDLPTHITTQRAWGNTSLWHRAKIVFLSFLRQYDNVKLINEFDLRMRKEFHIMNEIFINERDRYMSSKLLQVAREHNTVVAVVGKGHLHGIKKYWKQPMQPNELNRLLEMPSQKPTTLAGQIFKPIGVLVGCSAIVAGIYLAGK